MKTYRINKIHKECTNKCINEHLFKKVYIKDTACIFMTSTASKNTHDLYRNVELCDKCSYLERLYGIIGDKAYILPKNM